MPRPRPFEERLWEKVDRSGGPDACWPYTGALNEHGYARLRVGGAGTRQILVHRAAFLISNPGIEPPDVVDHRCHIPAECDQGRQCPHRRCCNPAHLAASTVAENLSSDRQWTPALRERCGRGHPYTDANTYRYTTPQGRVKRVCRTCAAANRMRRYHRLRAS